MQSAGVVSCPPLGCHAGYFLSAEGRIAVPGEANPVVLLRIASPGYFEAMGIRLRAGRLLTDGDVAPGGARSVVVNETFAKHFWPDGSNPVGRRVKLGTNERSPWMNVVGLVADIKHYGLDRPMRPGVYIPLREPIRGLDSLTMVLHTSVEPTATVASARGVVNAIDPELPMFEVKTMEQALHESMQVRATYSWLLAAFSGMAFLLALGGAYGVASYLVSQRTREIGIRVALGARNVDITRTIVGRGLIVVAVGIAVGLAASFGAARVMSGLLFETGSRDVATLAIVSIALLITALFAQLVPARRAARVDPMQCLRQD